MYQKDITTLSYSDILSKLKEVMDEGYFITIQKKRDLDQNSRYNILVRQIADYCGYHPNECKYSLKMDYGLVKNNKVLSTKDLSVTEMAAFIKYLEQKCIELNIKI